MDFPFSSQLRKNTLAIRATKGTVGNKFHSNKHASKIAFTFLKSIKEQMFCLCEPPGPEFLQKEHASKIALSFLNSIKKETAVCIRNTSDMFGTEFR